MQKFLSIAALALALAAPAHSATDGTVGTSSTGTAVVTVNVAPAPGTNVIVTGLNDIYFAALPAGSAFSSSTGMCVRINRDLNASGFAGFYALTVTSAHGSGGTFNLAGPSVTVPYFVRFTSPGNNPQILQDGLRQGGIGGSGSIGSNCPNTNFLLISGTVPVSVPAGATLTDTLTVLVEPE